jgi:hypothetical protein
VAAWSWGVDSVVDEFGVTLVLVEANEGDETREVVGAAKNEPSSKVSRKSL